MATATPPKVKPFESAEEAAPAPAPASNIIELVQKLTPEQKEMFRDALGVKNQGIKRRVNKRNNNDAKRMSALHGDVYRPGGGGFKPSEAIFDKGPEAVAAAEERWYNGQSTSARKADELEALAATAVM